MSANRSDRTSTAKIREDLMNWQLGTFSKVNSVATTLAIAEDALRAVNLQVVWNAQQGRYIVIGRSDAVIVAVSVGPIYIPVPGVNVTTVAVTATSADGGPAEQMRNQVRQLILASTVTG
jgi:hypothetical protein